MQEEFLKATIAANKEIYQTINSGIPSEWNQEHAIGAGGDRSTGFDLFCESVFIKHLQKFGKIDSEESGEIGEGENTIIIDPLDGSSNAYSNIPYYGSSVAFTNSSGVLEVAVVCNFANGDLFYKFVNTPLMVGNLEKEEFKQEQSVAKPKIGIFEKSYCYADEAKAIFDLGLKFRTPGAVALSLAYAHRVNFVIFKGALRVYDFAAAISFCEDLKVSISQDYVIVTHSNQLLKELETIMKEEIS